MHFTHFQRKLNSSQMTDAGPLSMLSEDEDDSDDPAADIKLPGVRKGGCGHYSYRVYHLLAPQEISVLARRGQRSECNPCSSHPQVYCNDVMFSVRHATEIYSHMTGIQSHDWNVNYLGRAWAAASTEGLLIYSLDKGVVFDPYDLTEDITPEGVAKSLEEGNFSAALMMSFRLNEKNLLIKSLEATPMSSSKFDHSVDVSYQFPIHHGRRVE